MAHNLMQPGRPYPLGPTWDGKGVNFALFSENAEKVELCLFDGSGQHETERLVLPEHTDHVWHGYLPEALPGMLYGYRVHGPYAPEAGHRFNHHKLLIDPYAKMLVGEFRWSDAHYGYHVGSGRADLSFDRRDNAHLMPKCMVVDEAFDWGDDRPLATPWSESVIYELHVRGFTMRHTDVPEALRGTFGGLASRPAIEHLRSLGVTAVELMPIHAFIDEHFLVKRKLRNYWGYATLSYFAPTARYMSTRNLSELKTTVKRLHDAGIEVILDVVYNHSCEADHLGPTISFRGIDNASYYRLRSDEPRLYADDTGCGNALNLAHPRVLQMVMDSLRYWVSEFHIDGFRFDLGTTLGREAHGFDPGGGFFDAVGQDPVLAGVKLIAEPWDVGPGGYQLGRFPPGWAEWNDRYRDSVRRFWRGDRGELPELGRRVTGSADLLEHNRRRPWCSTNYVTSHDGFSLADLVSYEHKHNLENGEDGRDGHNANFSTNFGVEGPTDDPEILDRRGRQQRNLLATVLFSQGTPMIASGDELGRSQRGNNNAYCQDNETTWLHWPQLGDRDRVQIAFTKRLIALRRRHPVLRRARFLHGRDTSSRGLRDIAWYATDGAEMRDHLWLDPAVQSIGILLDGDAGEHVDHLGQPVADEVLFLALNAQPSDLDFRLPAPHGGRWICLVDTAWPEREEGDASVSGGETYAMRGHSLALFRLDAAG